MKILIVSENELGGSKLIESNFVPRIGDSIDMFYNPLPIVKRVILWPSSEMTKDLGLQEKIDVIVTVD